MTSASRYCVVVTTFIAATASTLLSIAPIRAAVCLTLLESCVTHGVPYIDLADDRGFFLTARGLGQTAEQDAASRLCIGWSAVPALSGLLARMLVEGLDSVEELFIQIAPGNRFPRGKGTVPRC